ncbi:MAG: class I tRNA ligase family protein, partial [Bacteroidales bacterium]|nr:class I tRNA ligase family protein [Bacteroidales bacterium]
VIEDEYVDIEFGTGCLKVTPAHDVNDYMLGEKYNLASIDIFNDNGTISDAAGLYVGMDRFDVRKQIEDDLKAADLLEKVEDYVNKVGFSERTNVPIEPKLSMQWFLKMEHLAKPALEAVMNDDIKFYPAKYKNTYRHWMENIKDWCISRQLWWGHRIPAYYLPKGGFVVAETAEEALTLARAKADYPIEASDLRQDGDSLDTWFSSWLWPISLFDGINNPGNEEINYYYPTSDLVTAPDIIFFWVARMIMAGYEYQGQLPFRNVYFTGIVRDKLGRKMSKQLGNSPDPLELIEKYGADGVRMGMMLSAPAGNDILFDDALCEQGRNFNNKIWNAFRLVKGWQVSDDAQPLQAQQAIEWFDAILRRTQVEVADLFSKYRLSEALMAVYKLFWDEFSAWYLEMIKPEYGKPIDRKTLDATLSFFEQLLLLLHPFMPFITEELWQNIFDRKDGESIMMAQIPTAEVKPADNEIIDRFEHLKAVISSVRMVRNQKNLPPKKELDLVVLGANPIEQLEGLAKWLGFITSISVAEAKPASAVSFMVGTTEYAVPIGDLIDKDAEIAKEEAALKHLQGFLAGVRKKLSNEKFVANAPQQVIETERKKESDALQKIAALEESLANLRK